MSTALVTIDSEPCSQPPLRFMRMRRTPLTELWCCHPPYLSVYGEAYLLQDSNTGQKVVVKHVPLEDLDQTEVKNALREVEALVKLSHPNIIGCIGSWVSPGGMTLLRSWSPGNEYARKPISEAFAVWTASMSADSDAYTEPASLNIITEYMDGGSLDKMLSRNEQPYEEELVGIWIAQIVLAVDHMHRRNLLHRDIKPANIFITQSGLVKLGDLGCCQMLARPDETVTSDYGSPLYLSPEIWQNGKCNHKSDIWSIGCVAYELLAHKPPFAAPELAFKVLTASPAELPSQYSTEFRTLVHLMLEKNPVARPGSKELIQNTTVAEFISRWFAAGLTPLGDEKRVGAGDRGEKTSVFSNSRASRLIRMLSAGKPSRSQKK